MPSPTCLLAQEPTWTVAESMKVIYRDQEWELRGGMTARAAIKKVGLDPEAVLVVRNGQLVTDDTLLKDEDQVKLIAVVSGGIGDSLQTKRCSGR